MPFNIQCCIKEFRNVFNKRSVPLLYLFVERYRNSEIRALKSFAIGLSHDIEAVENAVAYDYSNGFVEGTNSRLKMIKRTMYGRCGKSLFEAKLRHIKIDTKTDNCGRTICSGIFKKFTNTLDNTSLK